MTQVHGSNENIAAMTLWVLGSNHRLIAPSRLQAAVARREEILSQMLSLHAEGTIRGGVLLSTCNRLELILDAKTDIGERELFEGLRGIPMHRLHGEEAVRYLLRVGSGLESMVRGEDQILGQLREAFKEAESLCLLSAPLRILRTRLTEAARDIRRRTGLSQTRVSVAALAARHLSAVGGRLAVIGAGETGRLALETLTRAGHKDLLVVNRTYDRARALANHFDCEAMALRDFLAARERSDAPQLDGILSAVHSDQPLLKATHVRGVRMLIDISMPSVLASEVRDVAGLEVMDLDAIAQLVSAEDARRSHNLEVADELVQARGRHLYQEINGNKRGLQKVIDDHVASALQEWTAAVRTKLRHLCEADQEQVRQVLLRAVRRNAHLHLTDLKQLVQA
ncbi:MAG: glutamyl-tRNA reductase [Planctomycetota bacterium]|jgi:glutamyl-tRNA reductase